MESDLDHFDNARAVLLTATPRRTDGQRLRGEPVYHYPLRQALEERIFKPIEPQLLELPTSFTRRSLDELIASTTIGLLDDSIHQTSVALVRTGTVQRAQELSALYEARGLVTPVLHSGLGRKKQQDLVDDLRSGSIRAVSVVGMLMEGFDLPNLRIVAYHDKHKSLLSTAQMTVARTHAGQSGSPG
jgi:superfamily II DNA or RNA helicase